MNEETQNKSSELPAKDNADGNTDENASLIDRADTIAKRIEEANRKAEANLKKSEELATRELLGGKSNIGRVEPKKEISAAEYAKAALQNKILK